MPYCANCGIPVEGRFCAKCGTPAGSIVGAAGDPRPEQPSLSAPLADNVAGALCYAAGLITGIIFLAITPYNRNRTIRFHAFQSIFAHVGVIVCYMGINILAGALHLFALLVLSPMLAIAVIILWIFMLVSAYQGKQVELPLVGDLARQYAAR